MFAKVTFTRGSGLGNRLFPWARAKLFSRTQQCRMLYPGWAHFRTASLRMGGIDYSKFLRKIVLWDNFTPQPTEVAGYAKLHLLLSKPKCSENSYHLETDNNTIVEFQGMNNHFADIGLERDFLTNELRLSIKQKWRNCIANIPDYDIAINVRLGNDFSGIGHTPIDWYIETLQFLNGYLGKQCTAVVISDGTFAQLRPLLILPNVEFLSTPAAVTDLFALTKGRLLLGSGGSSFTAWAAFLGGVSTFIHPSSSLEYFKINCYRPDQYIGPPKELNLHL